MPKTANPLTERKGVPINLVLTVAVLVTAAGIIGGVLLVNHQRHQPQLAAAPATIPAAVLRPPDAHTLSTSPHNKVTLVEFVDYQCPVCHSYYTNIISRLAHDYQGRVTIVTRNFPLERHPLALPAARAAEAAALQGKYVPMSEALEDNYAGWAVTPDGRGVSSDTQRAAAVFDQYARRIGLDLGRFHQDLNSPQVAGKINKDLADGTTAKVSGTPALFVISGGRDGTHFQPDPHARTFQQIDQQLRRELDKDLQ